MVRAVYAECASAGTSHRGVAAGRKCERIFRVARGEPVCRGNYTRRVARFNQWGARRLRRRSASKKTRVDDPPGEKPLGAVNRTNFAPIFYRFITTAPASGTTLLKIAAPYFPSS